MTTAYPSASGMAPAVNSYTLMKAVKEALGRLSVSTEEEPLSWGSTEVLMRHNSAQGGSELRRRRTG